MRVGEFLRRWTCRKRRVADLEERYDLNQLQRFEAALNRQGLSFRSFSAILDFGCGQGRLLRHVFRLAGQADIFGCDVLPDAAAECRKKYPMGHFIVNDPRPPIAFGDAQFDLIYSYSVFTHLSEPNHAAWLRELARTLRPGGVMLHTLHSYTSVKRSATFSPESLAKYKLPEPVDVFLQSARGYYYVVWNPATPEYGLTYISKEYVIEHWADHSGLTLVGYEEDAIQSYPEGCHDIVVLAKKTAMPGVTIREPDRQ